MVIRGLSKRDRIGFRGFLAWYHLHSIKIFEANGMKNAAYIEDMSVRFAQSILDSQDKNYDETAKNHPELIERYEREFQAKSRKGIGNPRSSSVFGN